MKKCFQIQNRLLPYLDNVLSNEDRDRIEAHLKICSVCREELDSLKNTARILSQQNKAERDEQYWQEFQNKLTPRLPPRSRHRQNRFLSAILFRPPMVFAAYAASFVLALGFLAWEYHLVRLYRAQTCQLQAKVQALENEKQAQISQIALLERKGQASRYQVVLLPEESRQVSDGNTLCREITTQGYVRTITRDGMIVKEYVPIKVLKRI